MRLRIGAPLPPNFQTIALISESINFSRPRSVPVRASHDSLIGLPEIAPKFLDFGEGRDETSGIKVEGKNPFAQTLQSYIHLANP